MQFRTPRAGIYTVSWATYNPGGGTNGEVIVDPAGGPYIDETGPDSGPTSTTPGSWTTNTATISVNVSWRSIQPTRLTGSDMRTYQKERGRLLKALSLVDGKKSACREYLESIGLNVNQIRENLLTQIPYHASRSLNDANEDFGHAGITVKQFFDNWAAQGIPFEGGAATGSTGRIYYSSTGVKLSIILHEVIHASHKGSGERTLYDPRNPKADSTTGVVLFGPGSALISDSELQSLMNISKQPDSTNITDELEQNGCK